MTLNDVEEFRLLTARWSQRHADLPDN